tara:strand:- start:705 stop:896 length:192 start_codon:yes stop_codon:yes gene_type:complete
MKNNEKVVPYIPDLDFGLKKSPYPAYIILKPHIRPVKGSRRPFLSFPDTKYHFNKKELKWVYA